MKRSLIIMMALILMGCSNNIDKINAGTDINMSEITIEAPVYIGNNTYAINEVTELNLLFDYDFKLNLLIDGELLSDNYQLAIGKHDIEAYVTYGESKSESIEISIEVIDNLDSIVATGSNVDMQNGTIDESVYSLIRIDSKGRYYRSTVGQSKFDDLISFEDINADTVVVTENNVRFYNQLEHFDIDFFSYGYMVSVDWGFESTYVRLLHIKSGVIIELPYYFDNLHFNSDLTKVVVFERHFAPSYYEMDYKLHVYTIDNESLQQVEYSETIDETAFDIKWVDENNFKYSYKKDPSNEFMLISPKTVTETKYYDLSDYPFKVSSTNDEVFVSHDSIAVLYNELSLTSSVVESNLSIRSSDFIDTISYDNDNIWYWFEVSSEDGDIYYTKRRKFDNEEVSFSDVHILTEDGINNFRGGKKINEDLIDISVITIYFELFNYEGPAINDWGYYSFNTNVGKYLGYFDMDYPGTYLYSPNRKMMVHYYLERDKQSLNRTVFIHGISGNEAKVLVSLDIRAAYQIESINWINDHRLEIGILDNDDSLVCNFIDGVWQLSNEDLYYIYENNPFTVSVNTEILNVRREPSIQSEIVEKVTFGESLLILDSEISGGRMWFKIGSDKWVDSQFTSNNVE